MGRTYLESYPEDLYAYMIRWNIALILDTKVQLYKEALQEYLTISMVYNDSQYEKFARDKGLATIRDASENAIVVADYGKGVITQSLMDGIRSLTHDSKVVLAVDPKVQNLALYRGVTLVTPNNYEAQLMSGITIKDEKSLKQVGNRLLKELDCQMVLVTQGDKGMTLFEGNGRVTQIPTVARKVFDVSGAGDTVMGTFTLALAAGLKPGQAAILANVAAGIVVAEVGTATVPASRLKDALLKDKSG